MEESEGRRVLSRDLREEEGIVQEDHLLESINAKERLGNPRYLI